MLSVLIKVRDTREEIILEANSVRAYKKDGIYNEVNIFYADDSGESWGIEGSGSPDQIRQDIYVMNDNGKTIATYHF